MLIADLFLLGMVAEVVMLGFAIVSAFRYRGGPCKPAWGWCECYGCRTHRKAEATRIGRDFPRARVRR